MPVTCARCGSVNPDGNQFCQTCGTPLTSAPAGVAPPGPPGPSGPPPGYAPPGPPGPPPGYPPAGPPVYASQPGAPPGYQSPYYAPVAAQAPFHRTPWVLIIGAIVALVVVMAGCGTTLAILGARSGNQSGGGGGILPSPSPAGSPSPVASPTGSALGPTATNAGERVPVPTGWAVANKDNESITLVNPDSSGSLTIGSGPSNPSATAQQNKDSLDHYLRGKYPDTKICPKSTTTTGSLNGAAGIFWTLCFTLTSGGQSFAAAAPLFVGANANGNVYYVVILLTPATNLTTFINQSRPVLQGIQWKLH